MVRVVVLFPDQLDWARLLSPQGLNVFFYLVIIAMLLKWFNMFHMEPPRSRWLWRLGPFSVPAYKVWAWAMAPDTYRVAASTRRRSMLLFIMMVIFAFDVSSHPLTPFFVITSVYCSCYLSPLWAMVATSVYGYNGSFVASRYGTAIPSWTC